MSMLMRFGIAVVVGAVCHPASAATALTLEELQRMLQAAPLKSVSYAELRESPWLASPIESRGTLHRLPDGLEKRVEMPRPETWRVLADRLEWVGPGGANGKRIFFSKAPALGMLAGALRNAVMGDLVGLRQDFRIVLQGDRGTWTAQLQPLRSETSRHIDQMQLEGSGDRLLVITIVERNGDRTTTRLFR